MKKKFGGKGFTLIELLIVIGIVVVLAGIVIVAINPMQQFAKANNARRWANVTAILNAVSQNIIDSRGVWTCAGYSTLPASSTAIATSTADICSCLVPKYIAELPVDPVTGTYTDCTDYNTGYSIFQDAVTKRITVEAVSQPENGTTPEISVTR